MDIDRFVATHRATWQRLSALTSRGARRLTADELDDLVHLYLRASSHLSTARTVYGDPGLVAELTNLVGRAGTVVYGTRSRTWRALVDFLAWTFPAAVWHARRAVLTSVALFTVTALVVGIWIARSPAAYEATMPAAVRDAYLQEDFEDYYSSQPAGQFAAWVFTNNVRVAVFAFAGGIALSVGTAYVLVVNGAHLGVAAGLFTAAGLSPRFWGLVLPHGLPELTAVFIAGGAGLRVGWAIIDPGDRRRSAALAEEARRSMAIVAGLVPVFLVAALVEALITPSPLPTAARLAVGLAVEGALVAYLVLQGRSAAQRGLTGALGESAGGVRPVLGAVR